LVHEIMEMINYATNNFQFNFQ